MGRGDFAAAESLLAGGPDDHPGLARLRGQLALRRRDGEAAARQFRIAVAADPTDRLALHGLGTALGMLGRAADARPYLEAARRHDALWALVARAATTEGENDPRLPHQLGMACAAIGRNLEARAWLKLAVRRDPLDDRGAEGPLPARARPTAAIPRGRPPSGQRPVVGTIIRDGPRARSRPGERFSRPSTWRIAMRGAINIIIGLVFIVGGLSGKLSMRGTQSGVALAVIGGVLLVLGIYRMATSRG